MKYLKAMLNANTPESLMRFLTLFVVADVMIVWNILCYKKGEFIPFSWENISLLAVMITGKVAQKFTEKAPEESADKATD